MVAVCMCNVFILKLNGLHLISLLCLCDCCVACLGCEFAMVVVV